MSDRQSPILYTAGVEYRASCGSISAQVTDIYPEHTCLFSDAFVWLSPSLISPTYICLHTYVLITITHLACVCANTRSYGQQCHSITKTWISNDLTGGIHSARAHNGWHHDPLGKQGLARQDVCRRRNFLVLGQWEIRPCSEGHSCWPNQLVQNQTSTFMQPSAIWIVQTLIVWMPRSTLTSTLSVTHARGNGPSHCRV